MPKIRVLLIDDAVVIRRLVGDVLNADPGIEVVGTAANGRIGLAKIPQVNPDLVTLDMEMPEMDGLETLKALRKTYPKLPVIMFSTLTARGAAATFDALALGANDYVTKPANVGSVAAAIERVREELVPKIKAFCPHLAVQPPSPVAVSPVRPVARPAPPRLPPSRIELVAIGASTGGPNALAAVLPALPADFPVPIVIVQHMPPVFTRSMADRLNAQAAIGVSEATAGESLQAGHAYVAPGDFHMTLGRDAVGAKIRLHQGPPENSCRPAVDVLFRSVAESFGGRVLAVILTGMGKDGLNGCQNLRDAGAQILAQDEATSVVWGMPGFVARSGLADQVLPLDRMASEITRRARLGRSLPLPV
ncbi:MAG TPA: chemotaxis response regulator protein-glutamate methylesterase [Pirellulales bacterium]|nr:chemotaxis response regulator protein-glutamate methylesterase [Pirellulales bacterium]